MRADVFPPDHRGFASVLVWCLAAAWLVAACSVAPGSSGSGPTASPVSTASPSSGPTSPPFATPPLRPTSMPSVSPSPLPTPRSTPSASIAATSRPTTPSTAPATPGQSAIASCPPPATVTVMGGWDPGWPRAALVSCLSRADVQVTGWLADGWGIGGEPSGIAPAWLGEWSGLPKVLWLAPHPSDGCFAATDCIWLFLFASKADALPLSPDRWVTLTGHFDDPVATTCRWVGPIGDPVSPAVAVEQCRGRFVVTEIEDAPAPEP